MFVILHDIAQNAEKVHYEMRFLPEDIRGMIRTEGETIVRLAGGDQQIVVETPEEIEAAIDAAKRYAQLRVDTTLAEQMHRICGLTLEAADAMRRGLGAQAQIALDEAVPIAALWHPLHPLAAEHNRREVAAVRAAK